MADINNDTNDTLLSGTSRNDYFWNENSNVTIEAGDGNDEISNDGSDVTIDGGAGNDTLYNSAYYATLDGGSGHDYISNRGHYATINGGAGNDYIYSEGGSSWIDVTIRGGDGKDTIRINNSNALLEYEAGDGNDKVRGFNEDDTLKISGGSYSTQKSDNDLIVTVGDGKISLIGAASLSAVNIDFEKIEWKLNGSTATYGSLTVKGVTSLDGIKLDGTTVTVSAASLGKNKVTVSDGYKLKLGSDVDKTSSTKFWTLDGTTATYNQTTTAGYSLVDNEIIYSKKSSSVLAKVKGVNDKSGLKVSGSTIKLSGDALSKKVTVSGDYVFDFDSAYSNATITGSSSADTILARGKNILVKGGDGSDVFALKSTGTIGDYDSEDKISLTGAADKSVTYIEGGDEKFFEPEEDNSVQYNADDTAATLTMHYTDDDFDATKYAGALVTIDASAVLHPLNITGNKNANNIFGTNEDDFIDGGISGDKIFGGAGNDTLLGAAGNDLLSGDEDDDLLSGGAGKDTLRGGAGNDELWGGAGNDVLEGGDGSDVFIYSVGDGNDSIRDYEQDVDIVKILSGVVKSPTTDTAGNVTFSMEGSGQLVFTDAANKIIEIFDGSGNLLKHYNPK